MRFGKTRKEYGGNAPDQSFIFKKYKTTQITTTKIFQINYLLKRPDTYDLKIFVRKFEKVV
jgi:hypothetical protein